MATVILKKYLVDILVKKISTQEVNPKTGVAFKVEVENALLDNNRIIF
jgi:hypothetical protein